MTTYDHVWETFLTRCKTDDLNLPTEDTQIYLSIQNAILAFNSKMDSDLVGDDSTELFNRDLDGDELLLFSHFIRLGVLENQLIYHSTTFSPFTKELGARNLGNQMNRLENLIEREDKKINMLAVKMTDDI